MIPPSTVPFPEFTWNRPIGEGWAHPYRVRYSSNLDDGPWHGMPLGGFGAGCVGRSHRGDFNLWHIDGGEHVFQSMPACQFSIFEETSESRQAFALCTDASLSPELADWEWYPVSVHQHLPTDSSAGEPARSLSTGTYHALYPRSWFIYQNVFTANISCEQFSPIVPHNYQDTSYPVAVFEWTLHNPSDRPITLSILLSWENMAGWFTNTLKAPDITLRDDGSPVYDYHPNLGRSTGNWNTWVETETARGCVLGNRPQFSATRPEEGDGQWAIATQAPDAHTEISYHTRWNPTGTGAELWHSFAQNGTLPNISSSTPAAEGERIAAALAVKVTLAPGETRTIPFVLTWDFPVTEFAAGVCYNRRYTDFFGTDGTHAWAIAESALTTYPQWQQQITDWQQPILDRSDLPSWFKMALFNELYDLTDGGTLWSAATDADPLGQFGVLECLDYCWYESLDVRLYGSFALLMLWPQLDKAVLRAFARAIPNADERQRVIGYYFTIGAESPLAERKTANATPHDLGAPNEHPWEKTNYTAYQDCNLWKDLASDFVLQVYRDFVLTGGTDIPFLAECWDAVERSLYYLKGFDLDGDCIPENSGAPDQTFDDWRMRGISAYCGGLWLAALEAAIAIGRLLLEHMETALPHFSKMPMNAALERTEGIKGAIATFESWLEKARPHYHQTLWNGQFYQLDSGSQSKVVMADQLCGQFYAQLLGLPDIVPGDCADSALMAVYQSCFLNFHNGEFGIANGVLPDGSPVNPDDTHPLEVWTGINFGITSYLIQMGYRKEALRVLESVIHQIYENGLQFRTPEAITTVGTFRACHYLRAMAIWLVYHTWKNLEER
ncbi:MAG: GH116 family glycosyl hydrolase [Leptolyngbyaceae bacterium]|nr:GH116 family glycosyl hydrolase [Leptolyngbyaceae bacterium]